MDTLKQKVQQAVVEIYQRDGEVKPTSLIEMAKPKSSPVHDAFEWDNKKAGHEFRLMQARKWIRKVEIIIEDRPEQFVHVPRIIRDDVEEVVFNSSEGYYKPISIVAQDQDEYEPALAYTLSKLNSAKQAYTDLKKAAQKTKKKPLPNFKKADRGFDMVETALVSAG
jgi:hypothetical protein